MTERTRRLLDESPVVRLRTRVHPAADSFAGTPSYDELYESAASFEDLYDAIVEDLVALATHSPNGEVVYAVPGSPVVAERTVELLRARLDVAIVCEPAVSVIDVACAVVGRDPLCGLRVLDALGAVTPLRGPGPLLVLQTYSTEVLAMVAARLPAETTVTVLHHLGLADQLVVEVAANRLISFEEVDHLTSLWIDGLRTAGEAMDDLVDFTARLRAECPWDQEQTHASLTRHLLEEAYETLDALEELVRVEGAGDDDGPASAHLEEELGDLLFQIVFHAELGDEEGRFNFATVADGVRDKLIGRHPHVFGDVRVSGSQEVASRWEALKRDEKGRTSITDGIAWQLPSLTLYTKLLRKAVLVDLASTSAEEARRSSIAATAALDLERDAASDGESSSDVAREWGDALSSLVSAARFAGVDLEGVLRTRALRLRDEIRAVEAETGGPLIDD